MSTEPRPSTSDQPNTPSRSLRIFLILLVAVACVVAMDGIINHWEFARTLMHWNALELRGTDDSSWILKAPGDCTILSIDDPRTIVVFDSLAAYDRPHREAGLFRLYFRISDSVSTTLAAMSARLSEVDESGELRQTVLQGGHAYRNFLRLIGLDTTKLEIRSAQGRDTLQPAQPTSGAVVLNDVGTGSEKDVGRIIGKVLGKNPTLLIGIGVGLAASAGLGLLKGETYVALAPTDVFRMQTLEVGMRAGRWEGKDIDIFWVFAPEPAAGAEAGSDRLPHTVPAHPADSKESLPDSVQP